MKDEPHILPFFLSESTLCFIFPNPIKLPLTSIVLFIISAKLVDLLSLNVREKMLSKASNVIELL